MVRRQQQWWRERDPFLQLICSANNADEQEGTLFIIIIIYYTAGESFNYYIYTHFVCSLLCSIIIYALEYRGPNNSAHGEVILSAEEEHILCRALCAHLCVSLGHNTTKQYIVISLPVIYLWLLGCTDVHNNKLELHRDQLTHWLTDIGGCGGGHLRDLEIGQKET